MKLNRILFGSAIALVIYITISSFGFDNFIIGNYIKGSGNVVKQSRKLSTFHALDVGGAFNIRLKQGSPQSVTVIADDNLQEHIITKVKGGELDISTKGNIRNAKKLEIIIVVEHIDDIELSGACNLETSNFITSNEMEIDCSGASNAKLSVKCKKLDLDFSGASEGTFLGNTKILKVEISGAANLDCENFSADVVDLEASGASNVSIVAHKTLAIDASGAASVDYKSKGTVNIETSGAASVDKK